MSSSYQLFQPPITKVNPSLVASESPNRGFLKISKLALSVVCLYTVVCSLASHSFSQSPIGAPASPVLSAARTEIDRDFSELKRQTPAPYFISYEIADSKTATVSSSFGALLQSTADHHRVAHVEVRVGDYKLDNTHQVRGRVVCSWGWPTSRWYPSR